jgi:hypothetical protein
MTRSNAAARNRPTPPLSPRLAALGLRSAVLEVPKDEQESELQPLNFRVSAEFRREFKTYAAAHDLKLLLKRVFERPTASSKAIKRQKAGGPRPKLANRTAFHFALT